MYIRETHRALLRLSLHAKRKETGSLVGQKKKKLLAVVKIMHAFIPYGANFHTQIHTPLGFFKPKCIPNWRFVSRCSTDLLVRTYGQAGDQGHKRTYPDGLGI